LIAAVLLAAAFVLEPGPYQSGFRTSLVIDNARPVLVKLWYPAADAAAPRLRYRDYLDAPPVTEFRGLSERISRFLGRSAKRSVLSAVTPSCRECAPAIGRFPVVGYFPGAGGTFAENTTLFEYLAGHGYVVVSSLYPSADLRHLPNNRTEPELAIADMQALLRWSRSLPFADASRVGAIGHSFGAQIILEWLGRDDMPLAAFVSLDSTLEYTPRDFPGHKELRDRLLRLGRPRTPGLLFARGHGTPANFRTYDEYLLHAPRFEAAVQHVKHDDFTMRYGRDLPAVRAAYQQVCRTILSVLDCHLKGESAKCSSVKSSGPVKLGFRPPVP
jgi:hypothetical protein